AGRKRHVEKHMRNQNPAQTIDARPLRTHQAGKGLRKQSRPSVKCQKSERRDDGRQGERYGKNLQQQMAARKIRLAIEAAGDEQGWNDRQEGREKRLKNRETGNPQKIGIEGRKGAIGRLPGLDQQTGKGSENKQKERRQRHCTGGK